MKFHRIPKILDVSPDYLTNGIFANLAANSDALPWSIDASVLDIGYYLDHSGNKKIAPLIVNLLGENDTLTNDNLNTIANYLLARYLTKWQKLYATLSFDYNPIENYNMTETVEHDGAFEKSGENENTLTHGHTVVDAASGTQTGTVQNNGTHGHGETITTQGNQNNNRYGFNSGSAVGDTTATVTGSETHGGNDTEINTRTDNLANSETHNITNSGNDKNAGSNSESGTDNYKNVLTRSGNIGTMTSQQMIESERQLWMWDFIKVVYADIDNVFALQVY